MLLRPHPTTGLSSHFITLHYLHPISGEIKDLAGIHQPPVTVSRCHPNRVRWSYFGSTACLSVLMNPIVSSPSSSTRQSCGCQWVNGKLHAATYLLANANCMLALCHRMLVLFSQGAKCARLVGLQRRFPPFPRLAASFYEHSPPRRPAAPGYRPGTSPPGGSCHHRRVLLRWRTGRAFPSLPLRPLVGG